MLALNATRVPFSLSWRSILDAENQVFIKFMLHMEHTWYMLYWDHILTTCHVMLVQLICLNANHQSFMNGNCSLKCLMWFLSPLFWVNCLLSLWGQGEPFSTACASTARKQGAFLGLLVTQKRMLLTTADGGTSTHGLWSRLQVNGIQHWIIVHCMVPDVVYVVYVDNKNDI